MLHGFQFSSQLFLYTLYLGFEAPVVSLAIVGLNRQRYTIAVLAHAFKTLLDHTEDLVLLAFENPAHGV